MNNLNWYWVYIPYLYVSDVHEESALKAGYDKVVFKSDADKYIAKLQSKITLASLAEDYSNLRNKRCNYCSELQRQKYKRCLAMAMYCHNQREIYERDSYDWELEYDAKDTLRNKANIMRKWRKRWLKLAEKFKEAK